jgi:hypothetical protein
MIKNVLNEIGGIGIYGVISICLFFAVFLGALVLALQHKPSFLKKMSALPLEDGDPHAHDQKGDSRHE